MIVPGFELCTDYTPTQVATIKDELEKGINPRDIKMRLAFEIVKSYTSEVDAQKAEEAFVATFQKKESTDDIKEVSANTKTLEDVLISEGVVASKGELRRLAEAGAITDFDTKTTISYEETKKVAPKATYKIGKNRFIKIV
jgi:tyrosyl-tRNA synthetase